MQTIMQQLCMSKASCQAHQHAAAVYSVKGFQQLAQFCCCRYILRAQAKTKIGGKENVQQALQDMLTARHLGPQIPNIDNMVARAQDLYNRWADWKDHYQVVGQKALG